MDELTEVFTAATRDVGSEYFQLKIDGGDPIYRERVYCYELYHRMRVRWPESTEYYLNGEVDKAAHPILRRMGVGREKPDLLVHKPGYMSGNFAIIEVKSARSDNAGIYKDLCTLRLFLAQVGYRRAIYLHFGFDNDDIVSRVEQIASSFEKLPPIELWVHSRPGEAANIASTLVR
ncbi:methionyl-tRNA formyltransferase-like protein [Tardiphaga sp.]|jgi:hypothetical protein|uniref:methionyl-tRNA formyltransferase-like protein n=1 Tax=Tardiphaga sp. TaxID=1926292 RepID=UPI0037DA0ECB